MDNIIECRLDSTCKEIYTGIWQHDYGQILRITGADLPKAVEVQFSLRDKGEDTLTRIGTTVDGVTEVKVPDSFLKNENCTQNYLIYAWIYVTDDASGNTEYQIILHVKSRPKPEEPTEEPLPEPNIFHETVEAVNASADRAENALKETKEIRDNLNLDLSEKITRPQTAEVGQVLAVKEIDESGKPTVFEAEDVKVPTKTSELENDSGFLTEHQDISGKLDKEKLPEAIDDALTQAKESGEFNGKDGAPGEKGEKGDPGETTYVENPYDDTEIKKDVEGIKQAFEDSVEVAVENKIPLWTPESAEVSQILRVKSKNDDGSVILETVEMSSESVGDVQIDGTSIVENGIAEIPIIAKENTYGLIKLTGLFAGLKCENGFLKLQPAYNNYIDKRLDYGAPITVGNLDYAVKAALCDGKGAAWTAEEQASARERMGTWITIADITLEEDVSMIEQIDIHGYRKYEIIVTLPSVIKTDCFIQPRICSATGQTTSMAYESAKNAQFLLFEIEEFFYCGGENYATFIGCESYKGEVGAVTPGNKKYSSVMFNYNNKEVYPYIASVGLIANGAVFPSGSRISIRGCD